MQVYFLISLAKLCFFCEVYNYFVLLFQILRRYLDLYSKFYAIIRNVC